MMAILMTCMGGFVSGFLLLRRIQVIPEAVSIEAEFLDVSVQDVSVIIPARNEAENLPTLLASLLHSQPPPAEVIVVDDGSTDNTRAIALSFGVSVITPGDPPPGWLGKNWACHHGVLAATSETLLFLDADTWVVAGGLERILSFFRGLPPDSALSILPFHTTRKPYEELSLFFNLLMAMGAGGFSGLDKPRLFGQSLILHRDLYLRAGGYAAIRGELLENLHFASSIQSVNGHTHTVSGRGTLLMRMFPQGVGQLCESWQKGFAAGARATSTVVLCLSVPWLSSAVFVFLAVLAGTGLMRSLAFAFYLLFAVQIAGMARQVGSFRLTTALLYPLPLLFYFALFGRSAWLQFARRPVTWKGRQL
ncbi:glycosyltransferase family 2 protein [Granulicella mallensis]|uniref:4,4'-diaponeurosporenoate glycosyltransferase n=1 Tax=Granulicella mallensis TaxID=940614 RepID=A0A7W7ZP95_9BACT|nr:glycosyltransferase [Granulicella mallensis]MBB5063283.1 4,4'-diaponeurosporenoate glycosyltransferase [Granulicella mallensis]